MSKAFACAVNLLHRRDHGARELLEKLQRKGFSKSEAEAALSKCQDSGFQSDKRFVEVYSHSRIRQGYGPLKITQELKAKGIDAELIEVELTRNEHDWLQSAINVWHKKSKGETDLSFDDKQKQQRFLLYRGFSSDVIAQVLRAL